jgi:hypothetical protein
MHCASRLRLDSGLWIDVVKQKLDKYFHGAFKPSESIGVESQMMYFCIAMCSILVIRDKKAVVLTMESLKKCKILCLSQMTRCGHLLELTGQCWTVRLLCGKD